MESYPAQIIVVNQCGHVPPAMNDAQDNRRSICSVQALEEDYMPPAIDRSHARDEEASIHAGFRVLRDQFKGSRDLAKVRQPLRSAPCSCCEIAYVLKVRPGKVG